LKAVNTNVVQLYEYKLDILLKAIKALIIQTNEIEDFVTKVNNDHGVQTLQTILNTAS